MLLEAPDLLGRISFDTGVSGTRRTGSVLDLLTYAGNLANLNDVVDLDFVEGDILDEELVTQLMREQAIDTLVHFAADKAMLTGLFLGLMRLSILTFWGLIRY